jgi:2-oxoglutarate dehydrogenase complex dehydrogenase (E1) component-like enzyme
MLYIASTLVLNICTSESQRLFNGYKKSGQNDNLPDFSIDQKKSILRKLNEAVSFENFCTLNMGKNVFTGRRRVNNSSS